GQDRSFGGAQIFREARRLGGRCTQLRTEPYQFTTTKRETDSDRTSSDHRFESVGCARRDSRAQIEPTQFHREFSAADRKQLERLSNVASQGFPGFSGTLYRGGTPVFPFTDFGRRHLERKALSVRNVGASPHSW